MAHEQLTAPRTELDQDLKDVESFSDEERFLFMRDLFHMSHRTAEIPGAVWHDSELRKPVSQGFLRFEDEARALAVDKGGRAEYFLPGSSSPLLRDPRSIETIRRLPRFQHEFYTTHDHLLTVIPQDTMYRLPKSERPYAYLSMSECSAVVGYADDDLYVAHIGFSEQSRFDAVLAYFYEVGISLTDTYIVGNTRGDSDVALSESLNAYPPYQDRYINQGAFRMFGVPDQNIITFTDVGNGQASLNIAEVIVDEASIWMGQSRYDRATGSLDDTVLHSRTISRD